VIEAVTIATSVLVGALVGRWWVVVLAVPAGIFAQSVFSFEGFSDTEVAVLFGIVPRSVWWWMSASGLVVGVCLRKFLSALSSAG
jgi:hypothetical protein